eukprot:1194720-Prorocentrum_minimum.AAC.11
MLAVGVVCALLDPPGPSDPPWLALDDDDALGEAAGFCRPDLTGEALPLDLSVSVAPPGCLYACTFTGEPEAGGCTVDAGGGRAANGFFCVMYDFFSTSCAQRDRVSFYSNVVSFYSNVVSFYSNVVSFYSNVVSFYSNVVSFYSNVVSFCSNVSSFCSLPPLAFAAVSRTTRRRRRSLPRNETGGKSARARGRFAGRVRRARRANPPSCLTPFVVFCLMLPLRGFPPRVPCHPSTRGKMRNSHRRVASEGSRAHAPPNMIGATAVSRRVGASADHETAGKIQSL